MRQTVKTAFSNEQEEFPLFVDLDGALVATDMLVESAFALLKRNVFYIFMIPFWLMRGKANLKHQIASRVDLDASSLPFNKDFLNYLKHEKSNERRLILATASNEKFAESISRHLRIFDIVLASDHENNLSGRTKLERIKSVCGEEPGFDYAGNSRADFPVWKNARKAILVNPEYGVERAAVKNGNVEKIFKDEKNGSFANYIKAIRVHQWLKNILIFVPIVTAHRLGEPLLLFKSATAFVAFSLCASSVYLLNDLVDLESDRRHETKRNRPLAAGSLPIMHGVMLIPLLLLASFGLALLLPVDFLAVLSLYYAITLAYSLKLKRAVLIDVITLAGLYTMRIIAGGAAVAVPLSFWLLSFSVFIFLSLAMVKRYSELLLVSERKDKKIVGRGYVIEDLETISQFGVAAGYLSALVLALYISSEHVKTLYSRPEIIWFLCPMLLYVVSRVWLMARRKKMSEDPLVFVIKDWRTWVTGAISGLLLLLAA